MRHLDLFDAAILEEMRHLDLLDAAILEEASQLGRMQAEYEAALDSANDAYKRLQRAGNNLEQLVNVRIKLKGRSDAI